MPRGIVVIDPGSTRERKTQADHVGLSDVEEIAIVRPHVIRVKAENGGEWVITFGDHHINGDMRINFSGFGRIAIFPQVSNVVVLSSVPH